MVKLYDKDDPNQVVDAQSPYGDESIESSDDPSPAAMHGRIVRLETNAKHVATNEGVARVEVKVAGLEVNVAGVEGKVDEVNADLSGKIDTVNADLSGKIDTVNADLSGKIDTVNAELSGKIDTVKTELVGKIETGNAKTETRFAKVDAKIAWLEKLLYVNIGLHIIDFAQDSPAIANLVNLIAKLFR